MNAKERDEVIQKTHDKVIELRTILLGKNSDYGLVGQVNNNTKKINRANIILGIIIGSGILGGGITGVLKLMGVL